MCATVDVLPVKQAKVYPVQTIPRIIAGGRTTVGELWT